MVVWCGVVWCGVVGVFIRTLTSLFTPCLADSTVKLNAAIYCRQRKLIKTFFYFLKLELFHREYFSVNFIVLNSPSPHQSSLIVYLYL